MKITGHKTITISDDREIKQMIHKVIEFGREYQKVEVDKLICSFEDEFKFSVELRGESEIECS